jgi:hypothetical protein
MVPEDEVEALYKKIGKLEVERVRPVVPVVGNFRRAWFD